MVTVDKVALKTEIAAPSMAGVRQAWVWRPLAAMTPAMCADVLRRASVGDARDYLLAAADIEEKDLHYRAVLQTRKLAVSGLDLTVAPGDGSPRAKRAAELAEEVLNGLDLPTLLVDLLDALSKGYAVCEILWRTDGGAWLPETILPREPWWFCFDRATGRELRLYDGSLEGAVLPAYKFLYHAPRIVSGLPLMGGLARSALWSWVFKSHALRDWAAFCELYGQPIRVGKYDGSATREDVDVLRRAVTEIGSDAAAVIPQSMILEFIESSAKSASAELYERLVLYFDRQVSKAVLGQTMTTDQGSSGSLAQAKVHDEVRADLLRADARALAATLRRGLLEPVIRLNLGDAPLPHVELFVEEPEDMAALADQLAKLVPLGTRVPERWVREQWGIPDATGGEPLLGAVSAPENLKPTAPGEEEQARQAFAELSYQASHAAAEQEPQDLLALRLHAEAAPAWQEILDQVRAMVEAAPDLASLREALLAAFAHLDTSRLGEVMALGFAAADLAGRFGVAEEDV